MIPFKFCFEIQLPPLHCGGGGEAHPPASHARAPLLAHDAGFGAIPYLPTQSGFIVYVIINFFAPILFLLLEFI